MKIKYIHIVSKYYDYLSVRRYELHNILNCRTEQTIIILININGSANDLRETIVADGRRLYEIKYFGITRQKLMQAMLVGKKRTTVDRVESKIKKMIKHIYWYLKGGYHYLLISNQVPIIEGVEIITTDAWPLKLGIAAMVSKNSSALIDLRDGGYSTISLNYISRFSKNKNEMIKDIMNDKGRGSYLIAKKYQDISGKVNNFYTTYDSLDSTCNEIIYLSALRVTAQLDSEWIMIISDNEGIDTISKAVKISKNFFNKKVTFVAHPREPLWVIRKLQGLNVQTLQTTTGIEHYLSKLIVDQKALPSKYFIGNSSSRNFIESISDVEVFNIERV
jgi:hypothetical protein